MGIVFWQLDRLSRDSVSKESDPVRLEARVVSVAVLKVGLPGFKVHGHAVHGHSRRLGHQELGLSALVDLSVRSGMNGLDFELGDQGRGIGRLGIGRCGEENGQAQSQRRNDEKKPDRFNHKPFHLRGHLQ